MMVVLGLKDSIGHTEYWWQIPTATFGSPVNVSVFDLIRRYHPSAKTSKRFL